MYAIRSYYALVAKMDPEASEKAYARRFADAGDFTFSYNFV